MCGGGDGDGDDAGAACDACDHSSTEHGQLNPNPNPSS